jgi:Asp-tRNA(Asn)/Glu-tRNA(Gln) amidotransferase A subunit family amidase
MSSMSWTVAGIGDTAKNSVTPALQRRQTLQSKIDILVILGLIMTPPVAGSRQAGGFVPEEATITETAAALAAGRVTCVQVVQSYLNRIAAYDDKGPALNAIITINPRALETAADMDRLYLSNKSALRALHCIPVILKDNYDTADMPTTGGSLALAESIPPEDAFIVRKLREAGALILAKANLTELARGGTTLSSLGGQTKNPYDLARTPGGSSGGTGAAIAASFGIIGTGSDTGQSIRSPASAHSLVGLRPTRGLISRSGIIPASTTQDEGGPITRTVEDAARVLDAIAGFDPADPITAFGAPMKPPTYTAFLDRDGLKGARIGVLTDFFGRDPVHLEVNGIVESAIKKMTDAGASILRINIPDLAGLTRDIQLAQFEFKTAFNNYLKSLGPRAPVKTLEEFISRGEFHPSLRGGLQADQRVVDGLNAPEYKNRLLRRDDLRQAVMTVFAANRLDAILYPHQRRLVVAIGEGQVDRNGVLSNSTGFPAITFPGGFSAPSKSAPLGVPVGIELLGPDWSEPLLIRLAYAFEQIAKIRRPPATTPPL